MTDEDASSTPDRSLGGWTPHLWVLVVPVVAVAVTYVFWFLVMAILRLPDLPIWLSHVWHPKP
jgi:hypothetical protein